MYVVQILALKLKKQRKIHGKVKVCIKNCAYSTHMLKTENRSVGRDKQKTIYEKKGKKQQNYN